MSVLFFPVAAYIVGLCHFRHARYTNNVACKNFTRLQNAKLWTVTISWPQSRSIVVIKRALCGNVCLPLLLITSLSDVRRRFANRHGYCYSRRRAIGPRASLTEIIALERNECDCGLFLSLLTRGSVAPLLLWECALFWRRASEICILSVPLYPAAASRC